MEIRFYQTPSGRSPVLEFVESLPGNIQADFYDALVRLSQAEVLSMPVSRNLAAVHKGLHELRFRDRSGAYRVLYYVKVKDAIYMLHGFKKKTQKTPPKELKVALKRLKEI